MFSLKGYLDSCNSHIVDLKSFSNKSILANLDLLIEYVKRNPRVGYIIFNENALDKILTNNDLRAKLNQLKQQLIDNIYSFDTFPSDYVLCLLNKYTYNKNDENDVPTSNVISIDLEPNNWIEVPAYHSKKDSKIFNCKIFKNETHKHLVVIFQAFQFITLDLLLEENANHLINKKISENLDLITTKIKNDLKIAAKQCIKHKLSLTLSGYSFGSWFALTCLEMCQIKYPHLGAKAVLFESAGSADLLKYFHSENKKLPLRSLWNSHNIKIYLTQPNIFNTCNKHFGNMFFISTNQNSELPFFEKLVDKHGKIASFQPNALEKIYINYKQEMQKRIDDYIDDRSSFSQRKSDIDKNITAKFKELKEIYEKVGFYVNGIECLTDSRLNAISNNFFPNQEVDFLRQIEVWPKNGKKFVPNLEKFLIPFSKLTIDYLKSSISKFINGYTTGDTPNEYETSDSDGYKYFTSEIRQQNEEIMSTDQYLIKLYSLNVSEIKTKFEFIRNHLIELKSQYRVRPINSTNIFWDKMKYKIISNTANIKIASIKRVLERLIYIDKHLQAKFRIIKKRLLNDCNYRCKSIKNNTHKNLVRIPKIVRGYKEKEELNELYRIAKLDFQVVIHNLTRENQEKYVDTNFRAINFDKSKFQWLRPIEINSFEINRLTIKQINSKDETYQNIPLTNILNNPSVLDSTQGSCNDCWLLSALASIAQHKDFLDEIFLTSQNSQYECLRYGFCQLQLCIKGKFKIITIDDNLVCRLDNRPHFTKTENNQLWACFIEKCLAKENSGYDNLKDGSLVEAFSLLTGYASKKYEFFSIEFHIVWEAILKGSKENHLMGAACVFKRSLEPEDYLKKNLVTHHVYPILKAIEFQSNKLVLLRNPYGRKPGRNEWSQRSSQYVTNNIKSKWTPETISEFRKEYPNLPIDCYNERGLFWLSFNDLSKYFKNVTICDYNNQKFIERIYSKDFFNTESKHFLAFDLKIKKDNTDVYIELFNDNNFKRYDINQSDMGFIVLNLDNKLIKKSYFGIRTVVCEQMKIKRGVYKIIPMSFRYWNHPNIPNKFNLVIHSSEKFSISEQSIDIRLLPKYIFEIFSIGKRTFSFSEMYILDDLRFFYAYNPENRNYTVETNINLSYKKQVSTFVGTNDFIKKPIACTRLLTEDDCKLEANIKDIFKSNSKRITLVLVDNRNLFKNGRNPELQYSYDKKDFFTDIKISLDNSSRIFQIDALHNYIPIK